MKLFLRRLFLFTLIITPMIGAQNAMAQKAEKNNDHRSNEELFFIQDAKQNKIVKMLLNNSREWILQVNYKKQEKSIRLGTDKMKEVDEAFVKKYFHINYVLEKFEKKCDLYFKLSLRGDEVSICEKDTKRVKEVENLLTYFVSLM